LENKLCVNVGGIAGAGRRRSDGAKRYNELGMKLKWQGSTLRKDSEVYKGHP
jgi:hypothetical protein